MGPILIIYHYITKMKKSNFLRRKNIVTVDVFFCEAEVITKPSLMILQRLDQKHKEHNTVEYVGKPKDEDFWKTGDFHDLHVETSFQPPGRRGFGQSEAPLGIWCYNTCFSRDAPAIKCLTWRRSETEVSSEGSSNSCWNVRAIFLPARKKAIICIAIFTGPESRSTGGRLVLSPLVSPGAHFKCSVWNWCNASNCTNLQPRQIKKGWKKGAKGDYGW